MEVGVGRPPKPSVGWPEIMSLLSQLLSKVILDHPFFNLGLFWAYVLQINEQTCITNSGGQSKVTAKPPEGLHV